MENKMLTAEQIKELVAYGKALVAACEDKK